MHLKKRDGCNFYWSPPYLQVLFLFTVSTLGFISSLAFFFWRFVSSLVTWHTSQIAFRLYYWQVDAWNCGFKQVCWIRWKLFSILSSINKMRIIPSSEWNLRARKEGKKREKKKNAREQEESSKLRRPQILQQAEAAVLWWCIVLG